MSNPFDPFGGDLFGLGELFGQKKKPDLPTCAGGHRYGSDDICHDCKARKPKEKLQLRRKVVDGTTYIHADDVASLLDAANVQAALAKKLRDLNK